MHWRRPGKEDALSAKSPNIPDLPGHRYMAIITFTTVGLGDFSPPFIYHDTTYLDVCLQYLCFAFASLIGLVGLSLLVHALDEWVVGNGAETSHRNRSAVQAAPRRASRTYC